jgi:thymidylate synthase (FAD)
MASHETEALLERAPETCRIGAMKVELLCLTPEPERIIEIAARTCYQSGDRMMPEKIGQLLPKLIAMGHESPFEHASATFQLSDVSRAMTHQLVRHRLMSVSQKSQRYVSEGSFAWVVPPSIPAGQVPEFNEDMETIRKMYAKWKARGLKNEDARFVLPNACTTEVVVSANFREWRHIFKVRCHPRAQWEIREVCSVMLRRLNELAPNVFADIMAECGLTGPQERSSPQQSQAPEDHDQ